MYHGILNIKKEAGFTSNDVVARLRGILRQKKIGHTGTLDPDAVGVLPVCLGNATRACAYLTDTDKEYRCVMLLGRVTDTQDISGKVQEEHPVLVSEEEALRAIHSFEGSYMQVPPMYSAKKVGGKKLYELAREGIEIERQAVPVTIYRIITEKVQLPEITISVQCSKGTYIRTLCHDTGLKLGCGACMKELVRTRAGGFELKDAITLKEAETLQAEGRLGDHILPTDRIFSSLAPARMKESADRFLQNGNELRPDNFAGPCLFEAGSRYRIYFSDGRFGAVYQAESPDSLHAVRMFLS